MSHFDMRFFVLFIALFFFHHPLQSESGEIDGINYEFNHVDSCFSFRAGFTVKAEFDCLISILYDFKHLRNIISSAKSITLIQQGEHWYDVCYIFKKLFFTNESVYRKTLKLEEQKIVFELISYKQSTDLFPKVISSSGYYRIKRESTDYTIEYFQKCKLKSSFLNKAYIDIAKNESIKFMLDLEEYVEICCH
jgi:hypothetical protein